MNLNWQSYALMTVFFWGVYGVILHMARGYMPGVTPPTPEGAQAGLKAFLLVCGAYCVTGVVTLVVLKVRGSSFEFSAGGLQWGAISGLAGALGAFFLVLALGAAAAPVTKGGGGLGMAAAAAVMPIVFGLAPLVNTITAMIKSPPDGGFKSIPLEFMIGCILAASGAFLVAKYAPSNSGSGHAPAPAAAASSAAAPAASKAPESIPAKAHDAAPSPATPAPAAPPANAEPAPAAASPGTPPAAATPPTDAPKQ